MPDRMPVTVLNVMPVGGVSESEYVTEPGKPWGVHGPDVEYVCTMPSRFCCLGNSVSAGAGGPLTITVSAADAWLVAPIAVMT